MELVLGNIFVRPFELSSDPDKTGLPLKMEGHAHNFDHVTYCRRGRALARCFRAVFEDDGSRALDNEGKPRWYLLREREIGVGDRLLIEAEDRHEFTAMEPFCSFDCIYSHRDPQSHEVIQTYDGWEPAHQYAGGPL